MYDIFVLAIMLVPNIMAFPWIVGLPGLRSTSEVEAQLAKRQTTCPFNANHCPAAPITSVFPYAGAQDGVPSTVPGNFQVPANGDTAHVFVPPGPNDIRGPCPGLNTAANHDVCAYTPSIRWSNSLTESQVIAHDGVTTFAELLDAQRHIYNVGYDLAVL